MLAGHETSASMMTWALYEMRGNQTIMKKVATEGESVVWKETDWRAKEPSDLPPRDEFANLTRSENCLKESLRKYSVVPLIIRRVVSRLDLGDYQIPSGSTLAINIKAVHHNEKYWPDPMKFDPHQFDERPAPYTFLPFLEGPRNCLGQHLSLLESTIVLTLLTQRYQFSTTERIMTELGRSPKDPRHQYIIPVTPKDELNVMVKKKV